MFGATDEEIEETIQLAGSVAGGGHCGDDRSRSRSIGRTPLLVATAAGQGLMRQALETSG
jgi:hypothetical protein